MEEPSEEPTSPLSKVTPIGSETSSIADDALPDKEPSRGEETLSPKSDGSVKLREVDEASSPLDESAPGRASRPGLSRRLSSLLRRQPDPNLAARASRRSLVLKGHTGEVRCLAALDDGRLVSGSSDKSIIIWSSTDGSQLGKLDGHSDGVRCITVLDGGKLASGGVLSADDSGNHGDFDGDNFDKTSVKILLVFFVAIVAIILLNVLIAIVSESYAEAQKNSKGIYYRLRIELINETRDVTRLLGRSKRKDGEQEEYEKDIRKKLVKAFAEHKDDAEADVLRVNQRTLAELKQDVANLAEAQKEILDMLKNWKKEGIPGAAV